MGILVLFSDFTESDNIDFINSVRELFSNKKYKLTYIRSKTDKELKYFKITKESLREYGDFEFNYFDSDELCNSDDIEEVFKSDIIFLSGGNTYYFLNNLKKRDLINRLRKYIENGGSLFGLSAGAMMMSKDIKIAQFCDKNNIELADLSSLGVVDFDFIPHWNQDSSYENALKEYTRDTGRTCFICNDGEGIVVKDKKIQIYGDIKVIKDGELTAPSEVANLEF